MTGYWCWLEAVMSCRCYLRCSMTDLQVTGKFRANKKTPQKPKPLRGCVLLVLGSHIKLGGYLPLRQPVVRLATRL